MKPNLDVAVLEDKGQPSLQGFRTRMGRSLSRVRAVDPVSVLGVALLLVGGLWGGLRVESHQGAVRNPSGRSHTADA